MRRESSRIENLRCIQYFALSTWHNYNEIKGINSQTRGTRDIDPFVLDYLLQFLVPLVDRIRPISRWSELSSCSLLIDEQSNPWQQLQRQDRLSQHRGPKHYCQYELLSNIRLLSLE